MVVDWGAFVVVSKMATARGFFLLGKSIFSQMSEIFGRVMFSAILFSPFTRFQDGAIITAVVRLW